MIPSRQCPGHGIDKHVCLDLLCGEQEISQSDGATGGTTTGESRAATAAPAARKIPVEGIEPTLPKERDFESRASANSATPASRNRQCCSNSPSAQSEKGGNFLRFQRLGRADDLGEDHGFLH